MTPSQVCPGEERLIVNTVEDYWECRELDDGTSSYCPPNGWNIYTFIDVNREEGEAGNGNTLSGRD